MFSLNTPRVKSRPTLRIFSAELADVAADLSNIKASELKYLATRDPSLVVPLKLSNAARDYLHSRYESPSKKHKTNWIDDLRTNHKLTSCPMCGGSGVTTIDHFLPKEVYPEFSCFPYNLVPSCSHCNNKRGCKAAKTAIGRGFIHPYFDHLILTELVMRCVFIPPYHAVGYDWVVEGGLDATELQRVDDHLSASVNEHFYREAMNANWRVWHSKARRLANVAQLVACAQSDLQDNVSNGRNCWDAMFLRGILTDDAIFQWMVANPNN